MFCPTIEYGRGAVRASRRPPVATGRLPVVGHSLEFLRSPAALLFRAQRELGEIAEISVFGRRMVGFFGPEAQAAIFRARDDELSPSEPYRMMTPVFGKDVVYDAEPGRMAEQLGMLIPALKESRMAGYGEHVAAETELAIAGWDERGDFDAADFARTLTNLTSTRCLLGPEFRGDITHEFAVVYRDLIGGVTPIAYLNPYLPLPAFRRRDRARAQLARMVQQIAGARRERMSIGDDFLQTLMEAHYADGRALSNHEITGILLAAMFAGHHTSSATTAWTLLELLSNRPYLARVQAEVDSMFGDGKITHSKIKAMVVTGNAIKETLRLHPPLFILFRVVRKDAFTYKDFGFPKGTWLFVSPAVAHRIPEIFRNPDRFDPDRFSAPRSEDRRDHAYIAFGGGHHACLGSAFALLQIKVIIGLLLSRYEFDLTADNVTPDYGGLVVNPKQPVRVVYRRRPITV